MDRVNPIYWWRTFLALPNPHPFKAVGVAFLVALLCSLAVSLTAVTLKPLRDANRLRATAASLVELMESLDVGMPKVRWVELGSGGYANGDSETQIKLSPEQDLAGLGKRETVTMVYELREDERLKLVILPVRGAGYQSTLKGYLVLKEDINTIAALRFYEQEETPGLGGRIEEKKWQALWPDKQLADTNGVIRIMVVKGGSEGFHEVDGISGATVTSSSVNDLLRFWLGADGYGPYLTRLKAESVQ